MVLLQEITQTLQIKVVIQTHPIEKSGESHGRNVG
jgi:hypothetical protein